MNLCFPEASKTAAASEASEDCLDADNKSLEFLQKFTKSHFFVTFDLTDITF